MQNDIKLDHYSKEALRLLADTNESFFLTGNGGTGKTSLINYFLSENQKKKEKKKVKMLATTGAAAVLYDFGQTYHSFFRVFGESLGSVDYETKKVILHYDTFIIDEASMISASQFDLINERLQDLTGSDELFGGKQMIFVGHLFQASPVVTEDTKTQYEILCHKKYDEVYDDIFFFNAKSFDINKFKIIELKKIHRTTDIILQKNLQKIMLGEDLVSTCDFFNKRFQKSYELDTKNAVYITNTNSKANKYNLTRLQDLKNSGIKMYNSRCYYWNWDVDKYGRLTNEPSPQSINFCVGCRIIFNKNTDEYKNGQIGTILNIKKLQDDFHIEIELDGTQEKILVNQQTWNKYETKIIDGEVKHEIIGGYTQLPFSLGWGITAHKSQGKTFNKIIIDIGQVSYIKDGIWHKKSVDHIVYVALSRATSYEGIQLNRWLLPEYISVNENIKKITKQLIK